MSTEAVEQLPRLIGQCPYCATYRMMYCIALANTHSTELNRALQQASCALPDRTQLFMLVNNGEHAWIELLHQLEQQRRDAQLTATADENGELLVPKAAVAIEDVPTPDPELIHEKAFLTESLAKLYVKQHKFEQALAIFSQLNLQYSKKSGNFADQIRYLEKVIALQKELMATSGSKKIQ